MCYTDPGTIYKLCYFSEFTVLLDLLDSLTLFPYDTTVYLVPFCCCCPGIDICCGCGGGGCLVTTVVVFARLCSLEFFRYMYCWLPTVLIGCVRTYYFGVGHSVRENYC